ncbi:low-affinity Fe(2+) transport protein [Monascus purpureus]|uniref:Low-affinity Fe(2+) transport protein n=1 Tax=Monascus purpureus TaxID=5098 RepID=A0A507R0C2_MONPU|nr:low-affinity Fe(2+) transport protein [Monascus purpureus]BDD62729.1 hypothetical protein MAP00_007689 [Monascus purpureus]
MPLISNKIPAWDTRKILNALRAPGRRTTIQATASTQLPDTLHIVPGRPVQHETVETAEISETSSADQGGIDLEKQLPEKTPVQITDDGESPSPDIDLGEADLGGRNPSRFGRAYDAVTAFAGTRITFGFTLTCLIVWGIVGGVCGATDTWQIVLQDASSIQCYFSDSLLMRQQQKSTRELTTLICHLRSRSATCRRLVEGKLRQDNIESKVPNGPVEIELEERLRDAIKLPTENILDVLSNWVALSFGSIFAFIVFWGGIIVWLAFGNKLAWGNEWQLYANTATAAELTFTSMFLQNIRQRHMTYLKDCLRSLIKADRQMEQRAREITGDAEPNPICQVAPEKITRGNRAIDYYASIVGSGVGLFISALVFIAWIAVGNTMEWNSNWWLIIGTYTGLVGFIDGFALRNVYFRETKGLDTYFQALAKEDGALYDLLRIPPSTDALPAEDSIQYRISYGIGMACSLPHSVLASVVIVVALICIASGLRWSVTGQLLCNTPTMIIEGFLLLVLMQAHNMSNRRRRAQLREILVRRLRINAQMQRIWKDKK